jgi:metallophosphoesterase superfamily enzyme
VEPGLSYQIRVYLIVLPSTNRSKPAITRVLADIHLKKGSLLYRRSIFLPSTNRSKPAITRVLADIHLKKGSLLYRRSIFLTGAGNGIRTRDPKLGKLVLCQLSYTRSKAS